MAVTEERIKAVASWGYLGEPGDERETQLLAEPLTVTLETDEIVVEIDDG